LIILLFGRDRRIQLQYPFVLGIWDNMGLFAGSRTQVEVISSLYLPAAKTLIPEAQLANVIKRKGFRLQNFGAAMENYALQGRTLA
jgi:hypothetical protein